MAGMRVSRPKPSERMKAGWGCLRVEKLPARRVRRGSEAEGGERPKGSRVKTKSTKSKCETGLSVQ